uniref:Uncharacterized protein n=1 Tax=Arundo donax TaxID=35708 RepID=A0A0A9GBF3_ARUDO
MVRFSLTMMEEKRANPFNHGSCTSSPVLTSLKNKHD